MFNFLWICGQSWDLSAPKIQFLIAYSNKSWTKSISFWICFCTSGAANYRSALDSKPDPNSRTCHVSRAFFWLVYCLLMDFTVFALPALVNQSVRCYNLHGWDSLADYLDRNHQEMANKIHQLRFSFSDVLSLLWDDFACSCIICKTLNGFKSFRSLAENWIFLETFRLSDRVAWEFLHVSKKICEKSHKFVDKLNFFRFEETTNGRNLRFNLEDIATIWC